MPEEQGLVSQRENAGLVAAESGSAPDNLAVAAGPARFSGSTDPVFSACLGEQVLNCHSLPAGLSEAEQAQRAAGVLAQMAEIGPRNGLEGMLAAQMVAMHGGSFELLRRAMHPGTSPQLAEMLLRTSTRSMTLFARQTELLLRLRGHQRQTLRIEHVRKSEDGRISVTAETDRLTAA